jgi:Tol biopolymer transport system component
VSSNFGVWTAEPNINDPVFADESPSVTADGRTLYFVSNRVSTGYFLYSATRASASGPFKNPNHVTTSVEVESVFARAGGQSIYFAERLPAQSLDLVEGTGSASGGSFDSVRTLTELNTAGDETAPAVIPSNLKIYYSSRADTSSAYAYDIWTASRSSATDPFGTPTLVSELNTTDAADVVDDITPDDCTIYFHSNRSGTFQEYIATRPN